MTIGAPLETEIKLAATPAMLEGLREHPALAGTDQANTLVTTYFDTADRRLMRAGASLRMRETGQAREQTIKLPARTDSIVVRGEWTVPALGDAPDIGGFAEEPRSALQRLLDGAELQQIAETRIERTVRRIQHGPAEIEIAFDQGRICAGIAEAAVCELELELVSGALADLLDLALALPLGPDLQWSVASKSARALALADGTAAVAARAGSAAVSRDMDTARGFSAIAWSCLSQLLENAPLVVSIGDPEALHQSRVAIRRLRAGLGLFGPLFEHDAQAEVMNLELKAAADALGPARDAHVLLERLAAAPADKAQDAAELLDHVRSVAERTMQSAQAFLAGGEFQALLFTFAVWVERGDWLNQACRAQLPQFAAKALRKRRRKIRHMGLDPAAMTVDGRHVLRIAVKKLRYAADFLAPLYRSQRAEKQLDRFKDAAAKVQDRLGELHDLDVLAAGREALFAGCEPIGAARLSAQLDHLIPSLAERHDKLLKRAGKALARLDACEPWWKADL
ncbi:MAG: inorganic triphosphatase [Novosphingobium sp.]